MRCSALSAGSCPNGSTMGQSGVSGAPSRLGCRSCSMPTAPRSRPPDRHGAPPAGCQAPRTLGGAPKSWPEDRSRGHRGDPAGIEPGGDGARRPEAGSPSLRHGPETGREIDRIKQALLQGDVRVIEDHGSSEPRQGSIHRGSTRESVRLSGARFRRAAPCVMPLPACEYDTGVDSHARRPSVHMAMTAQPLARRRLGDPRSARPVPDGPLGRAQATPPPDVSGNGVARCVSSHPAAPARSLPSMDPCGKADGPMPEASGSILRPAMAERSALPATPGFEQAAGTMTLL